MAKIGFNKLGLTKDTSVTEVEWNGQTIEVKQYLPINEKLEVMNRILNPSLEEPAGFFNPAKIRIYVVIEMVTAYTNITFTEKQREDVCKLYDLLESSGLYYKIETAIPIEERYFFEKYSLEIIDAIYKYKNSVLGILDVVQQDYKDVNFDAQQINEVLSNKENFATVREVLDKLD